MAELADAQDSKSCEGNLMRVQLSPAAPCRKSLAISIGIGILSIGVIAIVSIVAVILTYFLWNWLMPEIFAVKVITFWQAWGISFLAGILFKNPPSLKSSSRD